VAEAVEVRNHCDRRAHAGRAPSAVQMLCKRSEGRGRRNPPFEAAGDDFFFQPIGDKSVASRAARTSEMVERVGSTWPSRMVGCISSDRVQPSRTHGRKH